MAAQGRQFLIQFHATMTGNKMVVSKLQSMQMQTNKLQGTAGKATGSMNKMAKGTKRVGTAAATASKGTKTLGQNMGMVLGRAMITIPVWLALRSAIMGVIRTIGGMITAQLDLEDGMARLRTVMHGTSTEIERGMTAARNAILDMAASSNKEFKELAEAMYFLRTANLSTSETLAAFEPVMNAVIATGADVKEVTRAIAGTYNTMKERIKGVSTESETFQKIADTLTYTFATQDVQMGELVQSYTKMAPFVTGLSDSFTEITTTLGFLNTRMLRAGRTGRLTGRAILQLTKNADKLASIFGIAFDPNKPINFLEVINTLANKLGNVKNITASQGEALRKVFATRGATAVRLLVSDIDDLNKAIKLAEKHSDGFAKKLRKIQMRTVRKQFKRFTNILAVLTNEWIHAATAGNSMAGVLQNLNDRMEEFREEAAEGGRVTRKWIKIATKLDSLIYAKTAKARQPGGGLEFTEEMNAMFEALVGPAMTGIGKEAGRRYIEQFFGEIKKEENWIDLLKRTGEQSWKAMGQGAESIVRELGKLVGLTQLWDRANQEVNKELKEEGKIAKERKQDEEEILQIARTNKEIRKDTKLYNKMLKKENKVILKLLESQGLTALELAQATEEQAQKVFDIEKARVKGLSKEQQAEALKEEAVQLEMARLDVMEAQFDMQRKIKDNVMKDQINLLEARGISELGIINAKMQQLRLSQTQKNRANTLIQLAELRRKKEIQIAKIKQDEVETIKDLAVEYAQSADDPGRQSEIRELVNLRQKRAEELKNIVSLGGSQRQAVLDNLHVFDDEQKKAIRNLLTAEYPGGQFLLDKFETEEEKIEGTLNNIFKNDTLANYLPNLFSKNLKESGVAAMNDIFQQGPSSEKLRQMVLGKVAKREELRTSVDFKSALKFELKMNFANLQTTKDEIKKELAREINKELPNKLLENPHWLEKLLKTANIK